MKKGMPFTALIVFLCLGAVAGYGQNSETIDRVLDQESLTLSAGAYLVLTATSAIEDASDFQAAARALSEQGWWNSEKEGEEPLTRGEYSYMIMRSFDINGGLLFSIFGGSRYATRELAFLEFLEADTSPYRPLSGEEAVRILARVLEWQEAAP